MSKRPRIWLGQYRTADRLFGATVSLRPCPFCGGTENEVGQWLTEWQVICRCGAMGPAEDTKEAATLAWDERPEEHSNPNSNPKCSDA